MRGLRTGVLLLAAAAMVQGGFRLLVRPARAAALSAAEEETARLAARLAETEAAAPDSFADGFDDGLGDGDGEWEAEALAEELRRTRERVEALGGILARGGEAESVLHSLAPLAAEEGVAFRRFAPEPEYRLDGYTARAASVVAEGRFFDFTRFFERLSLLPQLVLIEDLEFRSAAGGRLASRFVAVTVRLDRQPGAPGPVAEDLSGTGAGSGGGRGR